MNIIALFKRTQIWHRKVLIIDIVHTTSQLKNEKWTMKDTAKLLGVSTALISEDLKLANEIRRDDSLLKLSRNSALKRIKNV